MDEGVRPEGARVISRKVGVDMETGFTVHVALEPLECGICDREILAAELFVPTHAAPICNDCIGPIRVSEDLDAD
jgi:hypothetical protein